MTQFILHDEQTATASRPYDWLTLGSRAAALSITLALHAGFAYGLTLDTLHARAEGMAAHVQRLASLQKSAHCRIHGV
ncbi:MAG: hypothetical protein ACRETW_06375 [Stenotrophobium sp.]